jgi:hypothetical protein
MAWEAGLIHSSRWLLLSYLSMRQLIFIFILTVGTALADDFTGVLIIITAPCN